MSRDQETKRFASTGGAPQRKRKFRPRLPKLTPPIPHDNSSLARFMLCEPEFLEALEGAAVKSDLNFLSTEEKDHA